jgi:hypothetical protein
MFGRHGRIVSVGPDADMLLRVVRGRPGEPRNTATGVGLPIVCYRSHAHPRENKTCEA